MNIDDVRRYRTAAFQDQVVNRLKRDDFVAQANIYAPELDQTELVQAITAKFAAAIAPVIGFDNVPAITEYEGTTQILIALVDRMLGKSLTARAATNFLLLFDEIGLLSAGAEGGYYALNSEHDILDVMRQEYSVLIPYIDVVDHLLELASIRNMFNVVLRPESSGGGNFMRIQADWFDAKTDGFKECVRLLLFEGDSAWQKKYGQLVELRGRLDANPALQLFSDEVDEIVWGLTGAQPLFRPQGFGLHEMSHILLGHTGYIAPGPKSFDFSGGIEWSMTSRAIYKAAEHPQSRTRALQEIRERLRSSAVNITLDENAAATRQLMQSLRNQVEPADSEHPSDDPRFWND
jgi:hypothetical protein